MTPSRRQVLGGAAALAAAGCMAADRPLWVADTHAADYPTARAVSFFAERVRELTSGRYDFRLYPGGQLGGERDTLEMTIFGGLDLNRVNLAPLNPIVPETIVPALPFVFRDVAHMRAAMDGAPGQRILEAMRAHGLVGLCYYDSGARSFYDTKRPITGPADMAGMKIRVQNSDLYVAMVEALGANATPMSFGEVYQALVQGVIDGAENNWPSYDATRHFEPAPYYNTTQHVLAPEVLVVSARRWAKIPEEDRPAFHQAAGESVGYMRRLWDARVEASKTRLLEQGVVLTEITEKSAFRERMTPVYERFVTSELRPLVEAIQDVGAPSV